MVQGHWEMASHQKMTCRLNNNLCHEAEDAGMVLCIKKAHFHPWPNAKADSNILWGCGVL